MERGGWGQLTSSELTTAVRAFTTRAAVAKPPGEPKRRTPPKEPHAVEREYPHEALVFDTETLPGPAQNLRFLVWRLYRDRPDGTPGTTCIEEGIAYPDQLERLDPASYSLIADYVGTGVAEVAAGYPSRLRCVPVSWWLEERLFRYGYAHRDRCAVVGFNLLFDLGRLAEHWSPAKRRYRGGFSLGFWGHFDDRGKWRDRGYRGRLRLRAIDPRRTLFAWATRSRDDPDPYRGPGQFVDLRTLTFALTDRSHSLETACAAFADHYEKPEVDYDQLTPELIGYAFEDIRHTARLYRSCLAELHRHVGVTVEPHRLYSPATVGARYLEAIGLRRPLVKFTGLSGAELGWDEPGQRTSAISDSEPRGRLDPRVLGWSMSAFFGGRAEARIVRTPVPVALVDFTSMYPSVNALLGTWKLLTAKQLETVDATERVRSLLADPQLLGCCLTPDLWAEVGVTLVEIEPAGDLLPTRARFDPASKDYGIGVNPLSYQGRLWYALPDVIAAVILGPTIARTRKPRVIRAIQLLAGGTQPGLQPVQLRGADTIDPQTDDPFVRMIEQRQRVLRDTTLDKQEQERLERFLKITANATAYGVLARFDRRERGKPTQLTVYGPDRKPAVVPSETPEDPGPYCFPPVAASITAAARLMLALLERLVHDHGGHYAFCDTDSMAILASPLGKSIPCHGPSGTTRLRALPWATVQRILARFDDLNPYDRELVPSPWKIEADSLERPLYCYAISAKRYCLYRRTKDGRPKLVAAIDTSEESDSEHPGTSEEMLADWSEHGLGLYLDPTAEHTGKTRRDSEGRTLWVAEAWQWILDDAHRRNPPLPRWASSYALTRFTVSSPTIEGWFKGYNASHPASEAIRPGSFGLIAHPISLGPPTGPLPTTTYEPDPARWPQLDWYDRRTGNPVHVTAPTDLDPETRAHTLARGDIPISLLSDIITRYSRRPEHKSLAPDGSPSTRETQGLLQRRPVHSHPHTTELTGKEGNKLDERTTGQTTDPADYRNTYGPRNSQWPLVLQVLHEIGATRLTQLTGFSRSAIYAVLNGATPRNAHAQTYTQIAVEYAGVQLARYLSTRDGQAGSVRRCEHCGEVMPPNRRSDARFCSDRCRTAHRRTQTEHSEATPGAPHRTTVT